MEWDDPPDEFGEAGGEETVAGLAVDTAGDSAHATASRATTPIGKTDRAVGQRGASRRRLRHDRTDVERRGHPGPRAIWSDVVVPSRGPQTAAPVRRGVSRGRADAFSHGCRILQPSVTDSSARPRGRNHVDRDAAERPATAVSSSSTACCRGPTRTSVTKPSRVVGRSSVERQGQTRQRPSTSVRWSSAAAACRVRVTVGWNPPSA